MANISLNGTTTTTSTATESFRMSTPPSPPVIFWTFLGMESLLIIIGNAMLIWLFCHNRRLRTLQNYFVMSLSVSDLLVGLTIAPCEYCAFDRIMSLSNSEKLTTSDVNTCKLFCGSVLSFNMLASTFNLVLIGTDRFFSIMRPFLYQEVFTKRRAKLIILVSWLWTLLCVCAPIGWQLNTSIDVGLAYKLNLAYGISLFSLVMLLGLAIGVGYAMIVHTIQIKMREMRGPGGGGGPTNTTGIKVCIMVAISFFLCWIPTSVTELIIVHKKIYPGPIWMNTSYFILLMNPLLDPLMYAYYRRDFRSHVSEWRQRRWKGFKKVYDRLFPSSSKEEREYFQNNNSSGKTRRTLENGKTDVCSL